MARDEKEKDKRRRVERTRDERENQDKRKLGLAIIRPNTAEAPVRSQSSNLSSLHLTNRDEAGPQSAPPHSTTSQPRIVTSTECLARSFRIASGNSNKIPGREKLKIEKPKALHTPPVWKPNQTRTSILRETAAKSAKDAKLKAASVKATRNESPTRGTGFSFPRSSPSRSVAPSPRKGQQPIVENGSRYPKYRDAGRDHLSAGISNSSLSPRYQSNIDSLFEDSSNTQIVADPISALRSPFEIVRRLHNSTDDSGNQSSEWSVDTSTRAVRARTHTPQSHSTNRNEEFSPFLDNQIKSRPTKKINISASTIRSSHSPQRSPSRSKFKRHKLSSSSSRLLVNSPVDQPTFHPPFEVFDSDDEYNCPFQRSPERARPKTATPPNIISSKEWSNSSLNQAHGASLYKTSSQAQNARTSFPSKIHRDPNGGLNPSKVKTILTISRGEYRTGEEPGTRGLIKSVRWDPAIVAVGRCLDPTDASESNLPSYLQVPTYESEDDGSNFMIDAYLNTVTQSFAKLKKTNPKVITQLLAALRDLKSDDESYTDNEYKRKLRLKPKPAFENSSMDLAAMKATEKENAVCEPLRPSDRCSLIQDKLASVIERMKNIRLLDDLGMAKQNHVQDAENDERWRELHPSVSSSFLGSTTDFQANVNQEARPPVSYADDFKSPTRNFTKEENFKVIEDRSPSRLNPLAPTFRDFSGMRSGLQGRKCEEVSVSPKQIHTINSSARQKYNRSTFNEDWRQCSRQPVMESINQKTPLKSIEPIWVDNSQLCKVPLVHDAKEVFLPTKESPVPDSHFEILPTLTQPQIFTVPPGYIPLIPRPGYLSQVAPFEPAYPQHTTLPPSLPTAPLLETSMSPLGDSVPSEEEQGRESQSLEAAWSQHLLKSFQAKYPLTGTRASPKFLGRTKIEHPWPIGLGSSPVVRVSPTLEPPVVQLPKFQATTPIPMVRKLTGNPQHFAKRAHASVIQQALEIKILQFKEKKAAETKEIQKKQIEIVERIIPLVRQQIKSKSADEVLVTDNLVGEALQRWHSAPNQQRMTGYSSQDASQDLAQHVKTDLSKEVPEVSSSAPGILWSGCSMKDSHSQEVVQAQELDRKETESSSQKLTPASGNRSGYSNTVFKQYQDQAHHFIFSHFSPSNIVAKDYMDLPKKPWEIYSVNEWHTQAADGSQLPSRVSSATTENNVSNIPSHKPGEALSNLPSEKGWRSQAIDQNRTQWFGTMMPGGDVPTFINTAKSNPQSQEFFPLSKSKVCDSNVTGELDEPMSDFMPCEDILLKDQVATLRSTWETLPENEWQDQRFVHQDTKPSSSDMKISAAESGTVSEATVTQSMPTSIQVLPETPESSNIGSRFDDPWKLLTVGEWELLTCGKSQGANPVSHTTETGSDSPFKAPKYLWDFLDLEFKLDDLQNLSSIARPSSRSSSSTVSEALSDALLEARRHLSLSQPKLSRRDVGAKNFSEASSSTVLSGYSMDHVGTSHQHVHLNFDWVPHALRSSTIDISVDSSAGLGEKSSEKPKRLTGSLLALIEGSAAEDEYYLKGRSNETSSSAVSTSTDSTGVPSEFGDGGEVDYETI